MKFCRTNTKKEPYTCRYCKLSYQKLDHASEHYCTRFQTFRKDDIPKDLFSFSDLRELKLKPKDKNKADAYYIYWTKKGSRWIRHVAKLWYKKNAKPPKKMTKKQTKAVERLIRLNKTISKSYYAGGFKSTSEIKETIQKIEKEPFLVLDTHTTGLDYNDEIIQIAVVNNTGKKLLDTFIKTDKEITEKAFNIHGIKKEDLSKAPDFKDVYPKLKKIISGKKVYIYNEDFDVSMLNRMTWLNKLEKLNADFDCVMEFCARLSGYYSHYHKSFTWMSLSEACEWLSKNSNNERQSAFSDCLATLSVLKGIARLGHQKLNYIEVGK